MPSIRIIYFFLLFAVFQNAHLNAQQYTLELQSFTEQNGLLHRDVRTVFEDKDGFIWIGGYKGLQRYDGHSFKNWTRNAKTGLIHYIKAIGQDDENWLWLWNGDAETFVFLNTVTEEILTKEERFGERLPFDGPSFDKDFFTNQMDQLINDSEGRMYFASSFPPTLHSYHSAEGFKNYEIEGFESSVFLKHFDQQGNLWALVDTTNICQINPTGKVIAKIALRTESKYGIPSTEFHYINGQVVIEYEKTISRQLVPQTLQIKNNNGVLDQKEVLREFGNEKWIQNRKWSILKDRIEIFDQDNSTIIQTILKSEETRGLFENSFSSFSDSKGNTWIYNDIGFYKVTIRPNRFRNYFAFEEGIEKSFNNSTRGIVVSNDTMIINFELSETRKASIYQPDDYITIDDQSWNRPLLLRPNKNIWIGKPFNIVEFSPTGKQLRSFEYDGPTGSGIWSFFEDKNERLWIGAGTFMAYKEKDSDLIQRYKPKIDSVGFTKRRGAIQNFFPEDEDHLWVCSWTGLYYFNINEELVTHRFANDEVGDRFLPGNRFYYLYKDTSNIYWLGTDVGLVRWDRKKGTHQLFGRGEGLSNDVIYAIYEDNFERLWLSSDYGIMSFDKKSQNVNTYLPKDGTSHYEFNRTSHWQSKNGTIYFGGLNGVTSFDPNKFQSRSQTNSKMVISKYHIFDGDADEVLDKTAELRKEQVIRYNPNDRYFQVSFSLLTFNQKNQQLYAYQIEGLDEEWIYTRENEVQFGKLPYGKHVLKIKGQTEQGGWAPDELAINIHVIRPFYLRRWFLIASALLLLFSIWQFIRWRNRRFLQRQKKLEEEITKATAQIASDRDTIQSQASELKQIDRLKTQFFANASHELKTPLTLITGPLQYILNRKEYGEKERKLLEQAAQNSHVLLSHVNELLDLTRLDHQSLKLNSEPTHLYNLIYRVTQKFEGQAALKPVYLNLKYQMNKDLIVDLDQNRFQRILNNLLSNALKFTDKDDSIEVQVQQAGADLVVLVSDTGIGINTEELPFIFDRFYQSDQGMNLASTGSGIGLAMAQEYATLFGGSLMVESEKDVGSTFRLTFPLQVSTEKNAMNSDSRSEDVLLEEQLLTLGKSDFSSKKVLIVEDNAELQDFLKVILEPHYDISFADNGREGLKKLENQSFDLIISDVMMPIMNGVELLNLVKANAETARIPFIMLTAKTDLQDKLTALRIGVDDYITKPFNDEELIVRMNNLLLRQEARQEIDPSENGEEGVKSPVIEPESYMNTWLHELEDTVKKEISNDTFNVDKLALTMHMSKSQLGRRIKQMTGLTPAAYILEMRLQTVRSFLENGTYPTIKEAIFKVGVKQTKHFSKQFKGRFGKTPSEVLKH